MFLFLGDNAKYDSKKATWKNNYEKVFKDNLMPADLTWYNKRWVKETIFKYNDNQSEKIVFSGDIIFNFFESSKKGKRRLLSDLIKIVENEKCKLGKEEFDWLMEGLQICNKRTETRVNVSLLPVTGSLQFIKQGAGHDRADTFIWCLHEHYMGNSILFNHCAADFIKKLKSFLDLFKNVEEYCDCIYNISPNLTRRLVESGSKPIDCAQRVKEYVILANKFWHERNTYFCEKGI